MAQYYSTQNTENFWRFKNFTIM